MSGLKEGPERMQELQELVFDAEMDYRSVAPHLKHPRIRHQLLRRLRETVDQAEASPADVSLLEIGAGDGGFVEPALAYGYRVTATEMSRPAVARLEEQYGGNAGLEVIVDEEGSLGPLEGRRFSAVLFASVLHHIPDYLEVVSTAVSQHLKPGGALITVQDPLWYPSVSRPLRWVDQLAFLSWRLTQGNYGRGVQTRLRRMRNRYDDSNPADTVEYHAVRDGVDQRAITEALSPSFEHVELLKYWSTPTRAWQRVGESLHLENTFGVIAAGYRGPQD